jgi:hypothetical protein
MLGLRIASTCARAALVRSQRVRRHWVILDNTAHGHAIADAACLQAILRKGSVRD